MVYLRWAITPPFIKVRFILFLSPFGTAPADGSGQFLFLYQFAQVCHGKAQHPDTSGFRVCYQLWWHGRIVCCQHDPGFHPVYVFQSCVVPDKHGSYLPVFNTCVLPYKNNVPVLYPGPDHTLPPGESAHSRP